MNYFKRCTLLRMKKVTKSRLSFKSISTSGGKARRSALALYVIPLTTFALGTWQVKRLEWKKGLIHDLETKTHIHPIPLPDDILDLGRTEELEYRQVFVEGKFDHTREVLLGPRSLLADGPNAGGGGGLIGPGAKSGYQIITPFVLTSGERILINRGWVSRDKKNPKSRLEGQIEDTILLTGLVRTNENRPQFTPKVKDDSLEWLYRDITQFGKILDTSPILLDADSKTTIHGGPIGGQTRVHLRNEHMNYIITWYSLTAATLFMIYQYRKNPAAMFGGPSSKMRSRGAL